METNFWGFLWFPVAVIIILPSLLFLMKLMEKFLDWLDDF